MTDDSLTKLDQSLAQRYGAYASYADETDPILVKTYGDGAADEVDRLLDIFATPKSQVLDLGFDQDKNLQDAARRRVALAGFTNVTFIKGNVDVTDDVATLPDKNFDLILSRRGPNVNQALIPKLKSDAIVSQELWQDPVGLLEMFEQKTFHGDLGDNPNWLVDEYSWLDLFPVSIKEYFDSFFRNASHLASYLSQKTSFYSWPMPPTP